jgi:hypothetical protein
MADHEHGDDSRLPVPAGERRPEVRRAELAPVDPAALVRTAGAPLLAPLAAAAAVGATAAAVTELVTRMMRPWFGGGQAGPAPWSGPGVHVSYTHLEVHWPLDR